MFLFLSFVGNKSTCITFQNRLEVGCINWVEAWDYVAVWLVQSNNVPIRGFEEHSTQRESPFKRLKILMDLDPCVSALKELHLVTMFCAEVFGLYIWPGFNRANKTLKRELWRFEGFLLFRCFLPSSLVTRQRTSGSQEDISAFKDSAFSNCHKEKDSRHSIRPAERTHGNLFSQ